MKKLIFSGLLALLSIMFIAGGIAHDTKGSRESATRCYVAAFAALAVAAVSQFNHQRATELCFLNKSFFNYGDNPLTRGELALTEFLGEFGTGQTKADAKEGKLKMRKYAKKFIFEIPDATSGTVELINGATQYVEGVIPEEWHNGRLPNGFNICITHLSMGFVADGTVTNKQAAVALASQPNSWPAVLRNGRLKFWQANNVKENIDCLFLGTMAASTGRIGEDDAFELDTPMILEELKLNKWELVGGGTNAFASPAGGNFLEIRAYGVYSEYRA